MRQQKRQEKGTKNRQSNVKKMLAKREKSRRKKVREKKGNVEQKADITGTQKFYKKNTIKTTKRHQKRK